MSIAQPKSGAARPVIAALLSGLLWSVAAPVHAQIQTAPEPVAAKPAAAKPAAAKPAAAKPAPAAKSAAPAAAKPSAPAATAAAAATAPAKPTAMLWEVRGPAGDMALAGKRLWLFGTMHVGKPEFYPLPAAVEKALASSVALAVEADITNQAAIQASAPMMLLTPPDTLESKLPSATIERLKKQLERLGVPYDAVKPMKPFILAGLLAVSEYSRQGFDQQQGVDGHLINKALARKLPIVELEGVQKQMKLMSGMADADQQAFLENSLVSLESGKAGLQMDALVKAWRSGDAAALEKAALEATQGQARTAELEELLLHSRNAPMQDMAESMLASGKEHFVAVGALHLVGKRGIVESLRAKGYVVTQH
ncbi:MAG: TraB/GumN family protein [Burkholderiales bacterium]|nr:TraB/GumN family protein [Burkholderiales bacterium]